MGEAGREGEAAAPPATATVTAAAPEEAAAHGGAGEELAGEAPGVATGNVAAPLSKNQQKKLLKAQRAHERKLEKRAEEKEKRRAEMEKRRAESQANFAALSEEEQAKLKAEVTSRRQSRMQGEKDRKERLRELVQNGPPLVIDLEFGSLMTPIEVRSLMQQMMYCYAANNRSSAPYRLCFTGVNGNMAEGFGTIPGFKNWIVGDVSPGSYLELFGGRRGDLVYLTADSPNEIDALDAGKIYIVGGLVDRNRHKNVTMQKAAEQGIQTARLPIAEHMKLSSSCVLTVNQVVDIMLYYRDLGGWKAALEKAIPPRKRGKEKEEDQGKKEDGEGDGGDDEPPAKAPRVEGPEGGGEQ